MNGEVDAFGVFMPAALVTGASAFAVALVLRRVLRSINAYAFIWHAGLFDVATFVVVWSLIAYVVRTPAA